MQRTAATPKVAVQQQSIRTSLVCKALPDRQQQVANVAALAATVSVLGSIAFAPIAFADLNVYEADAGGALDAARSICHTHRMLLPWPHISYCLGLVR
jgi:hypothetical protein